MTTKYPIPTTFPVAHPESPDVMIVGDDGVGLIAESEGFRYYLTDCCLASAKGSMGAVVCRACYEEIDEALGGIPPEGDPMTLAKALTERGFVRSAAVPNYYDTDAVRVVLTAEDGTDVIGWATGPGYGRGVIAWQARFDGNTPHAVVLAAVDAALPPSAVGCKFCGAPEGATSHRAGCPDVSWEA